MTQQLPRPVYDPSRGESGGFWAVDSLDDLIGVLGMDGYRRRR